MYINISLVELICDGDQDKKWSINIHNIQLNKIK